MKFLWGPALAGAAGLTLVTAAAHAQTDDDHATAVALVQQVGDEAGQDAAKAHVVAEPLARARDALERALRMRTAGDETHALAADGLAREWAETARDALRAADAENKAVELRRKAVDAQARVERERSLVEEAIARVGRLTAELEAVGRTGGKGHVPEMHEGGKAATSHGAARPGTVSATSATSATSGTTKSAEPKDRAAGRTSGREGRP